MITAGQIRAARGLLGWDATDLAEKTGLTRETISRIETDEVRPHERTMEKIQKAFNENRVDFLDNEGVRFRPEGVEVLNGKNGLAKFFDLVYAHAQISGGVIRQNGIKENLFNQYGEDVTIAHRARMAPLVRARKNIFVRAILHEGDSNFVCTNYADYRWHPSDSPTPVPYYIFGDNIGIFAFVANPAPKIVLISSPVIAQAYSEQFDKAWESALIPPTIDNKSK